MAEDTQQERTEDPTSKRLSEARKRGQLARSKELNSFVLTMCGAVAVAVFGSFVLEHLWTLMTGELRLSRNDIFDPIAVKEHLVRDAVIVTKLLAPFLGLMLAGKIKEQAGE